MVRYQLWVKAKLENVKSLKWSDGNDAASGSSSPCTLLCCSIRNPTDPENIREKIVVDFSDLEEPSNEQRHDHTPSSTGTHQHDHHKKHKHHQHDKPTHFHVTWSDNSKGTIQVVQVNDLINPETEMPYKLETEEWYPVMTLECQNVEPFQFHVLGNEFVVRNGQGSVYCADLSSSGSSWSVHELSNGTTALLDFQSKLV